MVPSPLPQGLSRVSLGIGAASWSLCEALHAALPFTVPNVIGEIFVDSPLRILIGWLGAWGLSGWLIGSMRALLYRDRSPQSLLYIFAPLLAALAASMLEAGDRAQPTPPENHIVLVRGERLMKTTSVKILPFVMRS